MLRRTEFAMGVAALAVTKRLAPADEVRQLGSTLQAIELRSGGRLGVYALSIGDRREISYRANERFPMCSTFKILAVAALLHRVDEGHERLGRYIFYRRSDLEAYAPVTTQHIADGKMTVAQLCRAAIVMSDNTAANLVLRAIGGPQGLTAFVRSKALDDTITRLDRNEPSLNAAIPGDPRDTTTPARMVRDLAVLFMSHAALTTTSARLLEHWMYDCRTGTAALRAGAPPGWYAADKTGSGGNGTRNDVAIFRPPHGDPVIVAAYLTGAGSLADRARNAVLRDVSRAVTRVLG